jgi:hypothetical protein
VFSLTTVGAPQSDDPSQGAAVDVLKRLGFGRQRDDALLTVLEPIVEPHHGGLPIEFIRQG